MGRRVSFTLFQKGAEEFGGRAGKRVAYLKSPYLSLPGGGGGESRFGGGASQWGPRPGHPPLLVGLKHDRVPGTMLCAMYVTPFEEHSNSPGGCCEYSHFPGKETRPQTLNSLFQGHMPVQPRSLWF